MASRRDHFLPSDHGRSDLTGEGAERYARISRGADCAAGLAEIEHDPARVDRLASDLIELSTRHNFAYWLAEGGIHRGWARSASGDTAQGIPCIEQGLRDFRATGTVLVLPYYLGVKAEANSFIGNDSYQLGLKFF